MIAIELRFITGKYHATPWGRQVNEGAVEWPPSPWRILRSLIATWYLKFPDVPEQQVRDLIDQLSAPPVYHLPRIASGHTRHYMPTKNDAKTKIFDTFICVPPNDPLVIYWPDAEVNESQKTVLQQFVSAISYFGRAESWVEAAVSTNAPKSLHARPLDESGVATDEELVRLLLPTPREKYVSWRESRITTMHDSKLAEKQTQAVAKKKPVEKVKLTPKDKVAIEQGLPPTTFDALQANTDELRKAGWSRPPASEWVNYVRKREMPVSRPILMSTLVKSHATVARFALASAVLPKLTESVSIGDRARAYVMGCSKKQNGGQPAEIFSGKSADGSLRSEVAQTHSHAHYLPESLGPNSRGKITHLTIFVPAGLSDTDEAALRRFTHMHGRDDHALKVVLLGIGTPKDFGGLDERKGQSPGLATSRVWISRTPFVPTDHLRIRNSERGDPIAYAKALDRELDRLVRKELRRRPWLTELEDKVTIQRTFRTTLGGTETSWLKFRRERRRGNGMKSSTEGFGFKLSFSCAVSGPIALGYGSHFGLGQFVAVNADNLTG